MSETLYVKRGKRYVPYANSQAWDTDLMRVGQWRMTYAYSDGGRRYSYGVTPDTASFLAACEVAAVAMEAAILEQMKAAPSVGVRPYTKRQLAIIERFRANMAEAGGLLPSWWLHTSPRDIVQAGIDAVRNWEPA